MHTLIGYEPLSRGLEDEAERLRTKLGGHWAVKLKTSGLHQNNLKNKITVLQSKLVDSQS